MALMYIEGFEGYAGTADMTTSSVGPCKWYNASGWGAYSTGSTAVSTTPYRTTQVTAASSRSYMVNCYAFAGNYGSSLNQLTIPPKTEVIAGIGFYPTSLNWMGILSFCGTSSTTGVAIGTNNLNQLFAATTTTNGGPNTVIGSVSAITLTLNAWHYIEARAKCHATTGELEVYVNGVLALNLTGINTATGSITSYQSVCFGSVNNNIGAGYFDDFYLLDKTGATNNNFLGPVGVYGLMPTSNGSATELAVTGSANNWEAVSEATNNTTTYVSTGTDGQKDYYNFQSLPAGVVTVNGALLKARSTMATSGTRRVKFNLKNGVSVISSALKALSTGSWLQEYFVSDTAPDGSAWTPTNVNSTEGGVEAG